jgi:hypothetical protein
MGGKMSKNNNNFYIKTNRIFFIEELKLPSVFGEKFPFGINWVLSLLQIT